MTTTTPRRPPNLLPLAEAARPCRGCGYCCHQAPCQFGRPASSQPIAGRITCAHLVADAGGSTNAIGRFSCALFEEITRQPIDQWGISPAFGAGCCSPLNPDRRQLADLPPGNA